MLSSIAPGNGGNGTYLDSLLQLCLLMKDTKDENSHPAHGDAGSYWYADQRDELEAEEEKPEHRNREKVRFTAGIAAIASLYYLILLMSSIYIVCNNI